MHFSFTAMLVSLATTAVATFTGGAARSYDSPSREFSADVVSRDAQGAATTVAHLFAARGQVRIETTPEPGGFFLIDRDSRSALFVRPAQRLYVSARQSSPLTQIFVPIDTLDPCPQWRAAQEDAAAKMPEHWQCDKVKDLQFRIAATDGTAEQRFLDGHLQFTTKAVAADGTSFTLENIREAVQLADLFTVPPGFHPFEPATLIERIKHSDVWAAPAN
jgi:hypothetical protein